VTTHATTTLRSLARLTVVFLVGWAACFWPARIARPEDGVFWMSVAAACCLIPGWIAVFLERFPAFHGDVKLMLGQMTVRFLAVAITGVVVRFIRPEFGLAEFYGWLILFYILAMVFEVVLLREKFSILTQSTANSLQDSQVSESTAGKL